MSALPRVVTPERRNSQRRRAATATATAAAASPPPVADIHMMLRDATLDDILPLVEEAYAAKMAKRGIFKDVSLLTVPMVARKGDRIWVQETKEKETECILAENWYSGDTTVSFMWECYQGRYGGTSILKSMPTGLKLMLVVQCACVCMCTWPCTHVLTNFSLLFFFLLSGV